MSAQSSDKEDGCDGSMCFSGTVKYYSMSPNLWSNRGSSIRSRKVLMELITA
jgi:hypothetical protein